MVWTSWKQAFRKYKTLLIFWSCSLLASIWYQVTRGQALAEASSCECSTALHVRVCDNTALANVPLHCQPQECCMTQLWTSLGTKTYYLIKQVKDLLLLTSNQFSHGRTAHIQGPPRNSNILVSFSYKLIELSLGWRQWKHNILILTYTAWSQIFNMPFKVPVKEPLKKLHSQLSLRFRLQTLQAYNCLHIDRASIHASISK
jgi:hypothetical protein